MLVWLCAWVWGLLRGIRDCGCGIICSYVGLGCSCVEGGRYFWHLLSGLLILVVVGLPLGCCEFVCVGLPHLFFWEERGKYVKCSMYVVFVLFLFLFCYNNIFS